jgi:hypothetical protein
MNDNQSIDGVQPQPDEVDEFLSNKSALDLANQRDGVRWNKIAIKAAVLLNVAARQKAANPMPKEKIKFAKPKPVRGDGNDQARIAAAVEKRIRKAARNKG